MFTDQGSCQDDRNTNPAAITYGKPVTCSNGDTLTFSRTNGNALACTVTYANRCTDPDPEC